MNGRTRQHGFTLLELVLVMIIAAIALAMAAPSLNMWNHGNALHNSAEDVLTLTRYAHTQAITDAVVYRLNFDTSRHYWLTKANAPAAQKDSDFSELGTDFGQKFVFPEGFVYTITKAGITAANQSDAPNSIDFYPSGRTQPGQILVSDPFGFSVQITCDAPAENFRITAEGKGLR